MKFNKLLTVLTVIFLLAGCASERINELMQSWVGNHQADLILNWGPPNETASDGRGGTILIYRQSINLGQKAGQLSTNVYGQTQFTSPQQVVHNRVRMFYVDPYGYIYAYKWKGT